MENFTALRNGILEHRRAGKMPPFDSGIFDHLIMRADWGTGIYHGCALALAFDFGDVSLKEPIQRCLRRLRDRRYINYPTGTGARGGYDILIHKYEVTTGKLSGMRLNAWMHNGLPITEYEPQNGEHTVDILSEHGEQTVGTPIQDIKTRQDGQDVKTTSTPGGAGLFKSKLPGKEKNKPPDLPDWVPAENWQGYVEMRRRMNAKAWTPRARKLAINELTKLRAQGYDPEAVLDQSVMNGWRGIFPIKGYQGNGNHNENRAERRQAENIAAGDEALEILQRRRMAN